jgi:putative ABC transport system permease protein
MARLGAIFARERLDRELAAELEGHLALAIDDNLRSGMTAEEARRQALIRLGGVAQVEERYRERRGIPLLENLARDLRFGARTLRRNPGFTAVAVLTLGLGIGANTAIFSVVNAVLLRPLPYPESDRLVLVWATNEENNEREDVVSYPGFEDWKARSRSFERLAAFTTRSMTLAGDDQAELVEAVQATPGFFETLGVAPALGRTFRPEESEAGASAVAVLSDEAWRRYFGGRRDVLGKTLRANEEIFTVVGVMPSDFRFVFPTQPPQIFVPLVRDPSRNHGYLRVLGRLRPEVRIASAQAEMDVIAASLARQYPETNQGVGVNILPLVDAVAGDVRTGLLIFLGIVGLVLLIACTNVANLMLARSASRQRELSLRAALGAGRPRLLQQMVIESTALALAGGALGLLLSSWTARLLVRLLGESFQIPRLENTGTDVWVFGFALLLSLATGLLFGAVFAPLAVSRDLHAGLRETGRTATGGRGGRRLRSALVVTETALALVLLAGAGILLKHLWVLRSTAPGFDSQNLLAASLSLPKSKAGNPAERRQFYETLQSRAAALPGVRSAALVSSPPLGGGWDQLGFKIPGKTAPSADGYFRAVFNIVSPDYFRTMAIPVRAGREFTPQDAAGPPATVINESAARFWAGEDPIGKTITLPVDDETTVTLTVVGVTGDVRQTALGVAPRPEMYLNSMQPGPPWNWLALVIRTAEEPEKAAGAVRSLLRSVDRDVPITQVRTFDEVISASLAQPRVYTLLLTAFAVLALALAMVGLYGVASYTVAQRTPEMGVRLALGAERAAVVRLVLRQGLGLALAGTAIGLAGALAVSRLITRLIPEAQPGDPLTLAGVCVLLIAVALAATYVPARRASRVDPTVALRFD